MPIVLQETLRAVFYAPLYAALELGAYKAEGVDVIFRSAHAPSDAPANLVNGTIDVVWGGPLRVIKIRDEHPEVNPVCFCELVTRDPFFLVGRKHSPCFSIRDLMSMNISVVREVPTPWLCLQEDIRRAGLDPGTLHWSQNRTMEENVKALKNCEVDAIQLFSPFLEEVLAQEIGHVLYAAAERGPTSYTAFYASCRVMEKKRRELTSLVRAVYRVQKWLRGIDGCELADIVSGYFPSVPRPYLVSAIDRYKKLGIWSRDPQLPRVGFERLRSGIVSGRFVQHPATYEEAVDNTLAEAVVRDNPPAWR